MNTQQKIQMEDRPSIFQGPVCLIGTSEHDGKLQVEMETLEELKKLEKSLVVVAIAGLYRTGKSYLMNRLAETNKGFALGSSIQSKTKGIWVWVREHPSHADQYLVLLDTEGLGDAEKGDQNHDNWIFCLATLLSSVLVYNALGSITDDALAKLNFVSEMSKHIRTKSQDEQESGSEFDMYFPMFIFVLRDFCLDLIIDGEQVDADGYLENCLTLNPDKSEMYNKPRSCIRQYFGKRKCFTFDRPAKTRMLKDLERLTDADLEEDFVKDSKLFCDFVFKQCQIKKLATDIPINGRMWCNLVHTYVEAIRTGNVPCVENAVTAMAKVENQRLIGESVALYKELMKQRASLPTETDTILSDAHFQCLKEALAHFCKRSIFDDEQIFQDMFNEQLKKEYANFIKENEKASVAACLSALAELNEPISEKLKTGSYAVAGGYVHYNKDLQQLQTLYWEQTKLGVKKNDALLSFLREKQPEGQTVMAADEKVTEQEKKTEAERHRAVEASLQKEMAERETELQKQMAADKEKAMKESMEQFQRKMEEERAAAQKHFEQVMASRLEEQARLMREGFERQAEQHRQEMDRMRNSMSRGGPGLICSIM